MKKTKKVLSYIWKAARGYQKYYLLTLVLYLGVLLIQNIYIPLYIKDITDFLGATSFDLARSAAVILGLLYLGERIFLLSAMNVLIYVESKVALVLDNKSFDAFCRKSYDFYKNQSTGSLVEKVKRLGNNSINITDNILFNVTDILVGLSAAFYLLARESYILLYALIVFVLLYTTLIVWATGKLEEPYEDRSRAASKFSSIASDIITNIQTVLYFASYDNEKNKFREASLDFEKKRYRAWSKAINTIDVIGFLPRVFTFFSLLYAIHLAAIGTISVGSVILIFLVGGRITGQLRHLARSMKMFKSSISDCVEAIEIIDMDVTVMDPEVHEALIYSGGSVDVQDVSFMYPGGENVFKNFSLSIEPGTSVGFVGRSGSGKTTITKLLLRLYDVDNGSILVDGQNVRDLLQKDLRSKIAYIPQETILFHRSIYDNISCGNPAASKEEILHAAKLAHVDEFVSELDEAYDTIVGERGIKLSGGQRQRIGIARAMLRKAAPILIMDEATSALDTKSEQFIQDSFSELSKNRTTLVVAHRLSTIKKLDRIIVMDKGSIIEDGSHDDLLKKNGTYADLWNTQIEKTNTLLSETE